jgi:hypothetical protein
LRTFAPMKSHLLALMLLATVPALAQTTAAPTSEASTPLKGASVIVLTTTDSAATAYTKVARLLMADGYALDKTDKELGFINTGYRATINKGVEASLRFVILPQSSGSAIELRGVYRVPGMTNTVIGGDSPIEMRGAASSPAGRAWEEMLRVSRLYPGVTITYKRQR